MMKGASGFFDWWWRWELRAETMDWEVPLGTPTAGYGMAVKPCDHHWVRRVIVQGPAHWWCFKCDAQADRNPKGHDPAEGHGRNDESPVGEADAPKGGSND